MILDSIMEVSISPLSDSTEVYPPSPRRYFQTLFSIAWILSMVDFAVVTTAFSINPFTTGILSAH